MMENNQVKSNGSKRGGARKGAGRKPGAATKKTREIADKAAAEGITPLEVMLRAMTALVDQADALAAGSGAKDKEQTAELNGKAVSRIGLLVAAADVAKDAAPYIHPRLAAVEHTGKDGKPLTVPATINVTIGKK
ncbi:hypothetical protein [Achromobacter xylosoxidans]|uniref:hypothetical protein n=1 Tax=Alcaligenes xylosoxydans xylosoxydans TaxID=85698 RepID=UPI001EEC1E8C|nr:hypothetical protein [Achromobacter xylosoxidans]